MHRRRLPTATYFSPQAAAVVESKAIASAIKHYFRNLEEPLLPLADQDRLLALAKSGSLDQPTSPMEMREVLWGLPEENRALLW